MDKIDAVTVGTPDHMHAIITAAAIKAGKHVYTQKPLTRTIYEARWLGELAKKHGVCTQMGNQGSVDDGLRKTAAQYRAGVVGEVKEVHVWTNRPIWPQDKNRTMTLDRFIKKTHAEVEEEARNRQSAQDGQLGRVDRRRAQTRILARRLSLL